MDGDLDLLLLSLGDMLDLRLVLCCSDPLELWLAALLTVGGLLIVCRNLVNLYVCNTGVLHV